MPRHVAHADGLPRAKLEAEEVLERAGRRVRHSSAGMRDSGDPSIRISPDDGSYSLASSFTSVVLPAPFSPTIATTAPAGSVNETSSSTRRDGARDRRTRRARSGCPRAKPRGRRSPAAATPPRSPRARPAAASRRPRSRAESRSRRPWRRYTRRGARRPRAPAAPRRRRLHAEATNTTAPTYASRRRPRSAFHIAVPQRAAAIGSYQRSHAARRSGPGARRCRARAPPCRARRWSRW